MPKEEELISKEAKQGEKQIQIKIAFWTDGISPQPGEIIPKHAWAKGVLNIKRNETHGIVPIDSIHFYSLLDLSAKIEQMLIDQGIVLHASEKMKKYLREE